MYDDKVREFVENIGLENIGKRLINNREKVEFVKPEMTLDKLLKYGQMLVDEQARSPHARLLALCLSCSNEHITALALRAMPEKK